MLQDRMPEMEKMIIAAYARPRPALVYHDMSVEEFIVSWLFGRFVEMFAVALVYLGANKTWPAKRDWDEGAEKSGDLTPEVLFELADRYYDRGLFWVLSERMCEQTYVMEELATRIERKEIGTNLVLIPLALKLPPDLSRVEKNLRVDKLEPFPGRENEYDAGDLKQTALVKAVTMINAERGINRISLPPYPLKLRPDIQNAWDTWMTEAWKQGMTTAFAEIQAGLTLDDETIRQKAHEHIGNLFDKTTRRRNILNGTDDFPEKGPDAWRAQWDFSKTAADNRRGEVHSETVGDILTPEDSLAEREIGAEAYDYALTRLGEQGRQFLGELIATEGNVTAASATAAVSRVTGTKWRNEIKIELSRKIPTK